MTSQVHEFQAETRQLLDLMVHSVYSNTVSYTHLTLPTTPYV